MYFTAIQNQLYGDILHNPISKHQGEHQRVQREHLYINICDVVRKCTSYY